MMSASFVAKPEKITAISDTSLTTETKSLSPSNQALLLNRFRQPREQLIRWEGILSLELYYGSSRGWSKENCLQEMTWYESLEDQMRLIEGKLEITLRKMVLAALPREAVGLILSDGRVVELTNLESGVGDFRVARSEILSILGTEDDIENVTFWHSHPGGGIGPSREDIRNRTPIPYHLVLTLEQKRIIPTWY